MGTESVPSYMFFTVDIPGALIACAIQYSFHKVHNNSIAYVAMLGTMIISVAGMLVSTVFYDSTGRIHSIGFLWQVFVGIGVYIAYSLLGTAAYDRLFGLLKTEGTCTFMVFMGDGLGYIGTTILLLYKTFSQGNPSDDDDDSDKDDEESQSSNSYLSTFIVVVYSGSIVIIACLCVSIFYFVRKSKSYDDIRRMAQQLCTKP